MKLASRCTNSCDIELLKGQSKSVVTQQSLTNVPPYFSVIVNDSLEAAYSILDEYLHRAYPALPTNKEQEA